MNNTSLINLDAERASLGCLLLSAHAFDDEAGIISADSFHDERHARVFLIAQELHQAGKPVDVVALATRLDGDLAFNLRGAELAGFIGRLAESVPHASHARHYAELVRAAYERRQLAAIANSIATDIQNPAHETTDIIASAEQSLHTLMEAGTSSESMSIADVLVEMETTSESAVCIETGFGEVDELLNGGMRGGHLLILAARPAIGKTALAGNIGLNAARRQHPVLMFSLEQTRKELAERLLSSLSGIEATLLKSHNEMNAEDQDRLFQAKNRLAQMPITVNDQGGLKVGQIAAVSRLKKRRGGLSLVIVDYLQLIEPEDKHVPREQQVATISRRLKLTAKELDVPVICLAQLNRSVETRENKRPRLSDLRESGAIEQDADVVMFLDRPATYNSNAEETEAHVIVGKNRHGQTGDIRLHWDGPTMTFKNAAPKWQQGWAS